MANMRTEAGGKLVGVVTVNDLSGVNLFGSSAFRDALSLSSKTAAPLYPGLAGPTILLNLPPLLNALVKLFKPLFPPVVAARIKFEQGPLSKVCDHQAMSWLEYASVRTLPLPPPSTCCK